MATADASTTSVKRTAIPPKALALWVVLALALIPPAFSMHIGAIGNALMIASILLVLIFELMNSAIEAITDRVSL